MDQSEILKMQGAVESALRKNTDDIQAFIKKANEEVTVAKSMSVETKAALDKLVEQGTDISTRLLDLEQKSKELRKTEDDGKGRTLGEIFIKSEEYKMMAGNKSKSARVELDETMYQEMKTAIINATGQNQPLVPAQRAPFLSPLTRRLTVRDLLPQGVTNSNLIEYARELVFTNNAGPQWGSSRGENVLKPESGITFELVTTPVTTIAHWIPVSKQVLEDAPMLESYINTRMLYGLALKEEQQLLNGTGSNGELSGLLDTGNFTAYNRDVTGDTKLDTIRRAMTQVALSDMTASGIVIHPGDWEDMELTKTDEGAYIFANPQAIAGPRLWGLPVVATQAITEGDFVVAAFDMAAQVWDRRRASIELSRENADNFVKNMITILAEERLALAVYRPAAIVAGTF